MTSTEDSKTTGTTPDSTGEPAEGASATAPQKPAEPNWQEKYVYLYAEFENFKKRSFKERQDTLKYALEGPASALLEVLDNFERALQFAKPDGDPQLVEGLKMVMNQFKTTLEKQGVTEVAAVGQAFNPEFHEGVGQIPSEQPAGTVAQCAQKGYTLHGRLIRAARVLVSSGPAQQ